MIRVRNDNQVLTFDFRNVVRLVRALFYGEEEKESDKEHPPRRG